MVKDALVTLPFLKMVTLPIGEKIWGIKGLLSTVFVNYENGKSINICKTIF
jgi:hypothetical protein